MLPKKSLPEYQPQLGQSVVVLLRLALLVIYHDLALYDCLLVRKSEHLDLPQILFCDWKKLHSVNLSSDKLHPKISLAKKNTGTWG